jgi:hypothetical protein
LGNRHGGDRKSTSAIAELDRSPKGNSIDIAAKRAGFASTESYERTKTVVKPPLEVFAEFAETSSALFAFERAAQKKSGRQSPGAPVHAAGSSGTMQSHIVVAIAQYRLAGELDERNVRRLRPALPAADEAKSHLGADRNRPQARPKRRDMEEHRFRLAGSPDQRSDESVSAPVVVRSNNSVHPSFSIPSKLIGLHDFSLEPGCSWLSGRDADALQRRGEPLQLA